MSGNTFEISSTWDLNNGAQKLENTVSLCYTSESATIENIVQLDTCIELINSKTQDVTCSVQITFPESSLALISKLSLVSEARIIEVHGPGDEYFTTCHADYVDDFEGCAVFIAEISITPSSEVHIKFARLKHVSRMWLYGIRLQLIQGPTKIIPKLANINFKNVNERLKDSGSPLSDKAERCKQFLQSYGLSESKNGADPQLLLKMLEAQCLTQLKPLGDTGRNVSKCLANLIPFLSTKDDLKDCTAHPVKNGTGLNYSGACVNSFEMQELKKYIDSKFHELEQSLLFKVENKIEQLERKQSEHYDNILSVLNSIKDQSKK